MTALAYSRMRGPGDFEPEDTDDRIAELTDQLVAERLQSPRRVAEALDELAGMSDHNSDGNTFFSADLAASMLGSESDALIYFATLRQQVRRYLLRDASTDAEFRASRQDDDAAEARDLARMERAA